MSGVSMTVPQSRRCECTIDGRTHRLAPAHIALLTLLMLGHPDHHLSCRDLIEALWPDPDTQPDTASHIVVVYIQRLRRAGVRIENLHGRGWRIPRAGRGGDAVPIGVAA